MTVANDNQNALSIFTPNILSLKLQPLVHHTQPTFEGKMEKVCDKQSLLF